MRAPISNERGQSLFIAIVVMLLLVVLGATFIVIVSRNLATTGRSTESGQARYLAEAGIRYADKMMTEGEEGADWRPAPDNQGAVQNAPASGVLQFAPDMSAYGWQWLRDHHPDFKWVRPYWPDEEGWRGPTGGYTTVDEGDGRYLLRVSYEPRRNLNGSNLSYDPTSKYIKIECVGRSGSLAGLYACPNGDYTSSRPGVCPNDNSPLQIDPTVVIGLKTTLRSELTAYKPIGLTDYCWFITNKEKRPVEAVLGCPGYPTQYGWYRDGSHFRGSPIRVNADLRWAGTGKGLPDDRVNPVTVYFSGYLDGSGRETPSDTVEVTGEIEHDAADGSGTPAGVFVKRIIDGGAPATTAVESSNSSAFTTLGGFYRDGRDAADADNSYTRSVRRIEPPLIDQPDPSTGVMRYRRLTAESGDWYTDSRDGGRFKLGQVGWGDGIYISNRSDLQPESAGIFGGYTPKFDWLNPNNFTSSYWQGPFYTPPGVVITMNPYDTDGDGQPDITITRTDISGRLSQRYIWRDAWGDYRTDWGQTVTVPYPTPFRKVRPKGATDGSPATVSRPGNGIIFADGNVRIKGMLPPSVKDPATGADIRYNLTIVSGGTIYIEGNVLKNRKVDQTSQVTVDNSGSVALLATEYVCVNTTQFISTLNSSSPLPQGSDEMNGEPPYHLVISADPSATFKSAFAFGPWDDLDSAQAFGDIYAFVRHAGQYGPAYINLFVNGAVYNFGHNGPFLNTIYGVGDLGSGSAPGVGLTTSFEHHCWTIDNLVTDPGLPNYLEIALAQTYIEAASNPGPVLAGMTRSDYLLSGLAIQPMNVRIEAIIYAQNKSFFVIPGRWFNPDPTDTRQNAAKNGGRRPIGTDPKFPFYGEPLDTRIVIDGAVSENLPASVADASAWMAKWGWTPPNYGSGPATAHDQRGLTFLYDPYVGWPVDGNNVPYRMDIYGRGLPIAPRLPVSRSLIYYGEPL